MLVSGTKVSQWKKLSNNSGAKWSRHHQMSEESKDINKSLHPKQSYRKKSDNTTADGIFPPEISM